MAILIACSSMGTGLVFAIDVPQPASAPAAQGETGPLGDWTGPNMSYDEPSNTLTLEDTGANNFAVSGTSAKAFVYEADITLQSSAMNLNLAGFLFGVTNKENPATYWGAVHLGPNSVRIFIEQDLTGFDKTAILDQPISVGETVHIKLEVGTDKVFKVYVRDMETPKITMPAYEKYNGGYVGFASCATAAKFENIQFTDNTPPVVPNFETNLENWQGETGTWTETENGYQGVGDGNCAAFSTTSASDFIYDADVTFVGGACAGGLIFRSAEDHHVYYLATMVKGRDIRLLKFNQNSAGQVINERHVGGPYNLTENKETYHLRVVCSGPSINLYVDNQLAITASDDESLSGVFGLNLSGSTLVFQNVNYQPLDSESLASLSGLESPDFQLLPAFSPDVYEYAGQVPYETDSISLTPTVSGSGSVTINGEPAQVGQATAIPLEVGDNTLTIHVKDEDTGFISITTLIIKRKGDPQTSYLEKYRSQFHFSPEIKRLNDPNGLIYNSTTGEYHMYYQYNRGNGAEWGHAVSKDMVCWEEMPIAMAVDELGYIFSGSAVIDKDNTSGLFVDDPSDPNYTPPESRMVAIYSNHGYGDHAVYGLETQSIAISTDNGMSWDKYDGNPVIGNEGNMYTKDFRDPKVIWLEDESLWLMVVAGSQARLFTSPDLIHWTHNDDMTYADGSPISSECPDLFPLKVDGTGETKWIYTGGGLFYVIGTLEKGADNLIHFKAESDRMPALNAGPDMYATQSFYNDPQGRRILISWMPDDTTTQNPEVVAEGKVWDGAQSLPMETKLETINGQVRLTSYPIEEVNALRSDLLYSCQDKEITPDTPNILADVDTALADIEATFTLGDAKEFGFNLRTGDGKKTVVKYNTETKVMTVDRDQSGKIKTGIYSYALEPLEGNKIKMRILVDTSIIDAFGNDGEAAFSCYFFTEPTNTGMEFFTTGGNVTIDSLNIYGMKSIWRDTIVQPVPTELSDLELSNGTLDPAFDKDTLNYTATVANSVSSVKVMLYCSSKEVVAMDKEMLEQFQILFQAIQDVKNEVKESETRINLKIENEVSKRIEAWYYQRK